MNAILAIVIFLVCNLCFPVINYYADLATVSETNIFEDSGVKNGDYIVIESVRKDPANEKSEILYYAICKNAILTYEDSSVDPGYYAVINRQLSNNKDLDWKYFLQFIKLNDKNEVEKSFDIETDKTVTKIDFTVQVQHKLADEEGWEKEVSTINASLPILTVDGKREFKDTGLSITKETAWLGWRAFGQTFVDFGESSTAIIRAFGSLFVSQEARDSTGGIIAIAFESTNILKNFGVNSFLRVWGMVSVNLAIVNLIPFPGLDGWQLLVLAVEATTRKKIPDKVKNIVSLVGLVLLFGLMIFLVIKDVFKYII